MNKNREYKSDLFSMLMEVPEYALEVYNVLNDTHYSEPSQIQIMKLEKGVRLSDAYEHQEEQYELDLLCIAYNINPGYNEHIQRNSKVLSGYTAFVEKVRRYANQGMILKDALIRTVDECISEDILAEFFREHRREVIEMEALDFTFERREKLIRRDSLEEGMEMGLITGRQEGRQEGEKIGLQKGKLNGKIELLSEMEYSVSEIAEKLAVSEQKVREVLGEDN